MVKLDSRVSETYVIGLTVQYIHHKGFHTARSQAASQTSANTLCVISHSKHKAFLTAE